MATCVDEKTFYEKLELLKENSKSKITVYIDWTFYENAKNYLEVQDEKRHGTEAELSKHDINTIKRKGWALKDGKIITGDNKIVVPKSELHKILCECHSSTAHRGRDKTKLRKSWSSTLKSRSKSCLCLQVYVHFMPSKRALQTTRNEQ